tara:strand:+ start:1935 stop:2180 length:246 start_codon:yes stop_codon:yes gene_type:complete
MIIAKEKLKDFVDACISSGKYIETGFKLPQKDILEIEDILNRYNDTTAKTKIRKVLKNALKENHLQKLTDQAQDLGLGYDN